MENKRFVEFAGYYGNKSNLYVNMSYEPLLNMYTLPEEELALVKGAYGTLVTTRPHHKRQPQSSSATDDGTVQTLVGLCDGTNDGTGCHKPSYLIAGVAL